MVKQPSSWGVRAAAALGLVNYALPVHAENASALPEAKVTAAEYDAHVSAALRFVEIHDWAEAKAEFERAHAVVPSARALRGLGVVSYQMGDYPESYRLLRSALAESSRPLDELLRAATEMLLARIR